MIWLQAFLSNTYNFQIELLDPKTLEGTTIPKKWSWVN